MSIFCPDKFFNTNILKKNESCIKVWEIGGLKYQKLRDVIFTICLKLTPIPKKATRL